MVIENGMKTRKQIEENLKKSYIVDGGEIRIGLNGDRGSNGILGTECSFKKQGQGYTIMQVYSQSP